MFPQQKLGLGLKQFIIGNGRSQVVEGHGNVQLKLASDEKFIFRNVIYIPV